MDHQTVNEFNRLGLLTALQLTALATRFHDETEDTIVSATHGQSTDQFVTQWTKALGVRVA